MSCAKVACLRQAEPVSARLSHRAGGVSLTWAAAVAPTRCCSRDPIRQRLARGTHRFYRRLSGSARGPVTKSVPWASREWLVPGSKPQLDRSGGPAGQSGKQRRRPLAAISQARRPAGRPQATPSPAGHTGCGAADVAWRDVGGGWPCRSGIPGRRSASPPALAVDLLDRQDQA